MRQHGLKTPVIVEGTKINLREDEERRRRLAARNQSPITFEKGKELVEEYKAYDYKETSALKNEGIMEVFKIRCYMLAEGKRILNRVKSFLPINELMYPTVIFVLPAFPFLISFPIVKIKMKKEVGKDGIWRKEEGYNEGIPDGGCTVDHLFLLRFQGCLFLRLR